MAFRANVYNEGSYYSLIPVFRKAVVPGESLSGRVRVDWESEPLSMNLLAGGVASVYAFYVPYRLAFPGWVDFISDPQDGTVLPTTTVAWPLLFETSSLAAVTYSSLGRRSFKLAYNQFFGDDAIANAFYDDISDDTVVASMRLKTTDQIGGIAILGADAPAATVVSYGAAGTWSNVTVEQLANAMSRYRSDRRSDLTGDKYVDALKRYGVSLDWRVQNAPELLGRWDAEFDAKETRATDAANTGVAQSRFGGRIECDIPRKFFAEHGIVMMVLAVRPFDFPGSAKAAPDAVLLNTSRDNVFQPDYDLEATLVENAHLGVSTTVSGNAYRLPRWAGLVKGSNLVGNASGAAGKLAWIYRQNKNNADVSYPNGASVVTPIDKLENDLAVCSRVALQVHSPVRLK